MADKYIPTETEIVGEYTVYLYQVPGPDGVLDPATEEYRDRCLGRCSPQAVVRARNAGAETLLPPLDYEFLLIHFNYACSYCGRRPLGKLWPILHHHKKDCLGMDHIVPLVCGGRHVPANITPACGLCNSRKSDMTLEEFGRKRSIDVAAFRERHAEAIAQMERLDA